MNDRIKLLAEQAFDKANNGTISDIKIPKEFIEKFAELIVTECLILADNIRDECDKDGENQQALGAEWVALSIARHFGVEE